MHGRQDAPHRRAAQVVRRLVTLARLRSRCDAAGFAAGPWSIPLHHGHRTEAHRCRVDDCRTTDPAPTRHPSMRISRQASCQRVGSVSPGLVCPLTAESRPRSIWSRVRRAAVEADSRGEPLLARRRAPRRCPSRRQGDAKRALGPRRVARHSKPPRRRGPGTHRGS